MSFNFKDITIDLVKKSIENKREFRIIKGEDYLIIDYVIMKSDTFFHEDKIMQSVLRQLRGIAFSSDGQRVISLPYHKFFNVGEKPETHLSLIDFSQPHRILNKLDGSMVRTIPINNGNEFRLATRVGFTEKSMQAEKWLEQSENYCSYIEFFKQCEFNNVTPIFEFVGPNNRIILLYEEDSLILTAMRNRKTGEYVNYTEMMKMANKFYIPFVQPLLEHESTKLFSSVQALKGLEGIVVRFDNGTMYKMKAKDYVDKHKAVYSLKFEHNILKVIFSNNLDDVLPVLSANVRRQIEDYRDKVIESAEKFETHLEQNYREVYEKAHKNATENNRELRKEFAAILSTDQAYLKLEAKFLFDKLDGKNFNVAKFIVSKATTQTKVEAIRNIIGKYPLPTFEEDGE